MKPVFKKWLKSIGYYPKDENPIGNVPFGKHKLSERFFSSRSFSQQGEDLTLDRILSQKLGLNLSNYKGLYVDAGAYHPVSHSTTYLLYKRGWQGVCIDISAETCRLFKKVRPKDIVVNAATSDVAGDLFFEQSANPALSNAVSNTGKAKDRITAKPLNSILAEAGINRTIDYLNIDTEGHELKTLMGLDFNQFQPKVISVEIHAKNVEEALANEVAVYLKKKGYVCVASNVITYFFIQGS